MSKANKKELPYSHKGDLTKGAVHKHLIRLTAPMVWGLFAVISVQLADTYFISLMGTKELAGISFTFPVTMLISHFLFGVNIAVSSVVSRLIGQKKRAIIQRVVLHAVMLSVTISSVIAVIATLALEPIFTLMGADEASMQIIKDYMPIWLIGFIFLSIPLTGNSAIRASGHAFGPAVIMTISALVNVILDPILIFGLLGAPALGVKGAAIATLIAYICAMFAGLYLQIIREKIIAIDSLHLGELKDSMKRLLIIAIPAGISFTIMPFTGAVIIALLATHGTAAVAAYGVVTRVEGVAMITIIALSTGMAPIIGQNWGAELYERVHKTINQTIGFNFVWSMSVALILGVFATPIASTFSNDPEVIKITRMFFLIVPITYAFGNLVFSWASSFNAMGMPKRSFVMILVKAFVLIIPAVHIGNALYGVAGIFCALASVNIIAGIFFHIISWRKCHKSEEARLEAEASA